jgi:superfamily II DNA or RNA helicase
MYRKVSPTKMYLPADLPTKQLEMLLTYRDKKIDFQIQKLRNSQYWQFKLGPEGVKEQIDALKAQQVKLLLYQDEGGYYTFPSLEGKIRQFFLGRKDDQTVEEYTYPEEELIPWKDASKVKKLRPYQVEMVDRLLEARHGAVEVGCHRKGEQVLMFDGTFKKVEDVTVGDQLMGPDSTPRNVLELKRGIDSMFEIETVNGQKMYVNGNHLLALRRTNRSNKTPEVGKRRRKDYKGKNPIDIITVNEYLEKNKKYKHLYKGFSVSIDFPTQEVPVDPYFLGVLIGDGSMLNSCGVTTADVEIANEVYRQADVWGLNVRVSAKENTKASTYYLSRKAGTDQQNRLTSALKGIGVWGKESGSKFVPQIYKANSQEVRLQVLAGLIDTDGSFVDGCYDYISKSKQLSEDVCWLARSLGFRASISSCEKGCQTGAVGTYWRVTLSGDLDRVPVRLNRKVCLPRGQIKDPRMFGFKVTKVADNEEHFGFTLDKDHLYLTDTFLVTHNTGLGKSIALMNVAKRLGQKTVVMTPSVSIARQIYDEFVENFGTRYVGAFFDSKKQSDKKFVISVAASLAKVSQEGAKNPHYENLASATVFIADESHTCPAKTLEDVCHGLLADAPYRFFFSGTQLRGDGLGLLLEAITGPIVYRMTLREGVEQGFLSKPVFNMVTVNSSGYVRSKDPNDITREALYYNPAVNKVAANIANKCVSLLKHPVLILVDEFEQFAHLLPHLKHRVAFAHGGVTAQNANLIPKEYHKSDPNELVRQFNNLEIPILVGTSCISTGTDIRSVKDIIFLMGGKSETQIRQAIGRGTRLFEGKTDFKFWDFDVVNVDLVHKHAMQRAAIYDSVYGPVHHMTMEVK